MKILVHSNAPWANTGYGQQVALLAPRLREAGHEVALSAFYGLEGAIGDWGGMAVYPTDLTRLGKVMLKKYVADFAGTDPVESVRVITLMDVWTWVDTRFGGIADFKGLNLTAWVPIDHDPVPPRVLQALVEYEARPVAMSRFGFEQLSHVGLDPSYAPHTAEMDVFYPRPLDAQRLRAGLDLPEDAFLVGMVANNQGTGPPRKGFPQAFQAFAKFRETHPNAYLYMHTDMLGLNDGVNLLALAEISGVPTDSIRAVAQTPYWMGKINSEQMSCIYSMFDVLLNPSYGEGFGIPILEAQACGTPVIVSDWTAMSELCGAGWKVQGDRWYNSPHGSFWLSPAVYEIVDALEQAYAQRGDDMLAAKAREFALAYDTDLVFEENWLPILAQLDEERPALNRAQRRAAARVAV